MTQQVQMLATGTGTQSSIGVLVREEEKKRLLRHLPSGVPYYEAPEPGAYEPHSVWLTRPAAQALADSLAEHGILPSPVLKSPVIGVALRDVAEGEEMNLSIQPDGSLGSDAIGFLPGVTLLDW